METLEQEKAEQRDSLSTQLGQLVAAYIEQHPGSPTTVKQHLALETETEGLLDEIIRENKI